MEPISRRTRKSVEPIANRTRSLPAKRKSHGQKQQLPTKKKSLTSVHSNVTQSSNDDPMQDMNSSIASVSILHSTPGQSAPLDSNVTQLRNENAVCNEGSTSTLNSNPVESTLNGSSIAQSANEDPAQNVNDSITSTSALDPNPNQSATNDLNVTQSSYENSMQNEGLASTLTLIPNPVEMTSNDASITPSTNQDFPRNVNDSMASTSALDPNPDQSVSNATKFSAGDETQCILTAGYFKNSKALYTTVECHLYRKNKYDSKTGICFWVCQDCKARVKTVGDPKTTEPTICTFADTYRGHTHPTKEIKCKTLAKKQELKELIDKAQPVSDKKVSVCHDIFKANVTSEE